MFLCRENELNKLNKRYKGGRFECTVIYGRRRVGKTAIINEFCKDKPTIFFSALDTNGKDNLEALSKEIYSFQNPDANSTLEYASFDDAFSEITRIGKKKRIIFVIDEYPYLAKADTSISSRLQHLIDHQWSDSQIFLILCGSSMNFMEYQVLGYESPLYGRRTAQFKIEHLNYRETSLFYPELPLEEQSLIYGITGGVPHYLNKLCAEGNLDDALLENVFERSAYLFEEPGNLLKQELRELAVYNSIITAIAEGASKLNEIAQKTRLETGPCSKYITVLINLGIVRKETPLMEKPGKKTIYQISDNFFRFWYRFVPANMAAIVSGRIERNYERTIKSQYSDYMGLVYEEMCKEYLLYYAKDIPIDIKDIGQWWGNDSRHKKQIQIDIVASSLDEKEFIIGSCKYKNEKIGVDELELMKQYASVFNKGEKYHYYIFSKGGFTSGLLEQEKKGEVTLVTLSDMYEVSDI